LSFLLNRTIRDDAPHLDPIEHQFRTLRAAGINLRRSALNYGRQKRMISRLKNFWPKDG